VKEYRIGGQTLKLEALPIGKLKQAMKQWAEADPADWTGTIAGYLLAVFDKGTHPFLTKDWIENNVTKPQADQIMADVATVNGLPNFLNRGSQTEERPVMEVETKTP
jgi:hypothetical protein